QEKNDVSTYFTDLKVLWDELLNYQPLPVCHCHGCTCNSSKIVAQNHHQTYVMTFLMGLNDVFDNVRGQILMMDPLPSINKAFSLVIQEERQRLVSHRNSSFASVESVALAAKSENSFRNFKGNARSRLLCSHCGLAGHIVDKCFKLHGYPPNYKFRDKSKTGSVNSVQQSSMVADNSSTTLPITVDQYQQLLALLQPSPAVTPSANMALVPNFSGPSHLEDDWDG
ncbi:hypothetical protein I3842_08G041700, partial [Carya illinoinensis]